MHTSSQPGPPRPEVAVGAVAVLDGRLLLVLRGRGTAAGRWSLPGGRLEPGERIAEGIVREIAEETGLEVEVGGLCGVAERRGADYHYVICNHWVRVVGPATPTPGDDAKAARWASAEEVERLPTVPLLVEWLEAHGVWSLLR